MQQHAAQRMPVRPLIPLSLAAFAGFLNLFGINPFFVDVAEEIGSTVSMVGYTATGALLMTALAGAIIGPVSQRIGARRTLIAGILVAAAGAVATALAFSYESLVLARLLSGVGGAVTGGVTIGAAALIYEGRQRQRALAIITAAMAMAVVVGVFLMTTAAEPYGWRGAFLILGGVLGVVAILNRVMIDPPAERTDDDAPSGMIASLADAYRPILGNRSLRRLFISCSLHPAVINGATAYIGAFLVSQHDVSTQAVGLVFSLIGITYVVGNVLAGSLQSRHRHVLFAAGVFGMGGFCALGYLLPAVPVVIALLFGLATFAGGISWVTLLSMVADRTPTNVSTAMVLTTAMHSLGGAIGIALSAVLLDITGYWGIGLGVGVLGVLAAGVGWVGPGTESTRESATRLPVSTRMYRSPEI